MLPILAAMVLLAPAGREARLGAPPQPPPPGPDVKQPAAALHAWSEALALPPKRIVTARVLQSPALGPFSGMSVARVHLGRQIRSVLAAPRDCGAVPCLGTPVRLPLERMRPVALVDLSSDPRDVLLDASAELDRSEAAPKAMRDPALLVRASSAERDEHHWTLLGLEGGELKVLWSAPAKASDGGGTFLRTDLRFEAKASGRPSLVVSRQYVAAKGPDKAPKAKTAVERYEWDGKIYAPAPPAASASR